jgi:hypothetical protein
MKHIIIIGFAILLMIFGCEIEEQVNKAANRCEDKISKILESVEDVCLTKEEILELISSNKIDEGADTCSEEGPQG